MKALMTLVLLSSLAGCGGGESKSPEVKVSFGSEIDSMVRLTKVVDKQFLAE